MRVLVVEDDPGVRDGILALLRSRRFDAAEASNGAAALEIIPKAKPDVILLDLAMPVVAGDEFLEKLRSDPDFELGLIGFCGHLTKGVYGARHGRGEEASSAAQVH